jgi:hypothetical protein
MPLVRVTMIKGKSPDYRAGQPAQQRRPNNAAAKVELGLAVCYT